jgi:hypothetical protein
MVEAKIRGTFMSLIGSVQMLASGLASVIAGAVVTIGADGKMEHYNLVGYGAAACGLLTFCLIGYIHTDKLTVAKTNAKTTAKTTTTAT